MNFNRFEEVVKSKGFTARRCSEYHWQVLGGKYTVNCYPTTFKLYVNGTVGGVEAFVTSNTLVEGFAEVACKWAMVIPNIGRMTMKKAKRRKDYSRIKKRLLMIDPTCCICGKEVTSETATIDHWIPLDKGGTNGIDNLKLAHEECNRRKDNQMPHTIRVRP